MSYDIVYERLFIRTPQGYLPQVLIGSSNLRSGRRRPREWCNLFDWESPLMTEEELSERVEQQCGRGVPEHFRYNGKWVDDDGLRRFVTNAARQALSFEELRMIRPGVSLRCYVLFEGYRREMLQYCDTTDELLEWVAKAKEFVRECGGGLSAVRFTADKELNIGSFDPNKRLIARQGGNFVCEVRKPFHIGTSSRRKEAIEFGSLEDAVQKIPEWAIEEIKFSNA